MKPGIWRIIVIILAIAFVPMIFSGVASLVTAGVHGVSHNIDSMLRPLSMSGDDKLEGLIRLCLYLVAITLLARFLFKGR